MNFQRRAWNSPALTTFAFVFGFLCLFPYPALPIGDNLGLQASHTLTLLALPAVLFLGIPKRQALVLGLLLVPLLASTLVLTLTNRALSVDVALNSMAGMLLALVVLFPAGWLVREQYMMPLLSGVAAAIVIHAAVGAYQVYAFSRDRFPLLFLYRNPSFDAVGLTEEWQVYVKRPFGLFPEPSAMSASIGPWLILILVLLLYPSARRMMNHGTRWLLSAAVVGGLALLVVSQSGYVLPIMAGLGLAVLPRVRELARRAYRPGAMLVLAFLILGVVAVAVVALVNLDSRLVLGENSSWSARLASLIWGLSYLGRSPADLLFGVGPGQPYLILQQMPSAAASLSQGLELSINAVWSVVVAYVQETGLIGVLALATVLVLVLRAVLISSAPLLGLGCFGAWLAGVTLATSYLPLSPIWLFLGLLLGWDRVFRRPRGASESSISTTRPYSSRTVTRS